MITTHNLRIQAAFRPQTFGVLVVTGRCIYDLSIVRANVMFARDRTIFGVAQFVLQRIEVLTKCITVCRARRSQSVEGLIWS